MAAQKYNNNQAHVFWSHDWRPQAYQDIYYSRWSCTPDLKENHGSWGHELACAQTPPPTPQEKSEKVTSYFSWLEEGSVHRLATNTSGSSKNKKEINRQIYARIQLE